jgi:bacterioferritin-associated ferredoxin
MFICVCRKITDEEARETSEKIRTYFPRLSPEKKLELFNTANGQPICGLCREQVLAMLNDPAR